MRSRLSKAFYNALGLLPERAAEEATVPGHPSADFCSHSTAVLPLQHIRTLGGAEMQERALASAQGATVAN
jgi:hypothetical protein